MDIKALVERIMEDYDDNSVTTTRKMMHFIGDILIIIFAIFLIVFLNSYFRFFGIIFLVLGLFETYKDDLRFIKK